MMVYFYCQGITGGEGFGLAALYGCRPQYTLRSCERSDGIQCGRHDLINISM